MRWTERQRAMLREMGIGPWQREPAASKGVAATAAAPAAAEPARRAADERPEVRPDVRPEPKPGAAPRARDERTEGSDRRERTESASLAAADWLVVGEAPAADSAAAEAQLLDNLMRAIGVARDASARSGRAAFLAIADGDVEGALPAAIAAVQPRCILAFGRNAALALLGGDESLGALRSAEHRRSGVPVVVTCALAFLLRHADEKARVWAELCRAVRALDAAAAADDAG